MYLSLIELTAIDACVNFAISVDEILKEKIPDWEEMTPEIKLSIRGLQRRVQKELEEQKKLEGI